MVERNHAYQAFLDYVAHHHNPNTDPILCRSLFLMEYLEKTTVKIFAHFTLSNNESFPCDEYS
jgi:hypothetical protein